jgi:RNA polymerase sigma-70 factor (ECF subfamily)
MGGSGVEPGLTCAPDSLQNSDPAREGAAAQDTALMIAVGQGSAPAFGLLVERHTPQLYRLAARMLGDRSEAEDVVQECFTRLWQNAPRWQPTGAGLVGWLHRVAMNLCLDRKRRFRVIITPDVPDCEDPAPLADLLIEADQARCAVADALAALPARHRAALVLCYYEGLSKRQRRRGA